MNNPKVSIISATFNSSNTLQKTIDSIYNQTYSNFEYIIIDGGSTDNTLEIIKKNFEKFNGRLIYISEKDCGIYDAWNKGLKLSTGEWITFIGSDDYFTECALTDYINVINNNPLSNFISSQCMLVNENYVNLRIYGEEWSKKMNIYCTIAHVGSFHKKILFKLLGQFDISYKVTGDYDFLLKSKNIIKPIFFKKVTAFVLNSGISSRNIFFVSKERTIVKLRNKSRNFILCYFDFITTILKYYFRKIFIN